MRCSGRGRHKRQCRIKTGATAVEIKRKALEEGMFTLRMSGLEKIKSGVTTIEEVLRETVL
jgi:type IV pilus assembly protein PilB